MPDLPLIETPREAVIAIGSFAAGALMVLVIVRLMVARIVAGEHRRRRGEVIDLTTRRKVG